MLNRCSKVFIALVVCALAAQTSSGFSEPLTAACTPTDVDCVGVCVCLSQTNMPFAEFDGGPFTLRVCEAAGRPQCTRHCDDERSYARITNMKTTFTCVKAPTRLKRLTDLAKKFVTGGRKWVKVNQPPPVPVPAAQALLRTLTSVGPELVAIGAVVAATIYLRVPPGELRMASFAAPLFLDPQEQYAFWSHPPDLAELCDPKSSESWCSSADQRKRYEEIYASHLEMIRPKLEAHQTPSFGEKRVDVAPLVNRYLQEAHTIALALRQQNKTLLNTTLPAFISTADLLGQLERCQKSQSCFEGDSQKLGNCLFGDQSDRCDEFATKEKKRFEPLSYEFLSGQIEKQFDVKMPALREPVPFDL